MINEIFFHFAVFLERNNHFEILHSVVMDSTKPASINRQTGRLITTSLALFLQLRTREINDFDPIFPLLHGGIYCAIKRLTELHCANDFSINISLAIFMSR